MASLRAIGAALLGAACASAQAIPYSLVPGGTVVRITPLGPANSPGLNANPGGPVLSVATIAADQPNEDGEAYLGGSFNSATAAYVAYYNGFTTNTFSALPSAGAPNGVVNVVRLWVNPNNGSKTLLVGAQATSTCKLARFNIASGATGSWQCLSAVGGPVSFIAPYGDKLAVGGTFTSVTGVTGAARIVLWNGVTGAFSAAGTSPFTTGEVRALTQDDSGNLWAGLNTASTLDSYLWKFDGATWTAITPTPTNNINALLWVSGRGLYTCGSFLAVGSDTTTRYAAMYVPSKNMMIWGSHLGSGVSMDAGKTWTKPLAGGFYMTDTSTTYHSSFAVTYVNDSSVPGYITTLTGGGFGYIGAYPQGGLAERTLANGVARLSYQPPTPSGTASPTATASTTGTPSQSQTQTPSQSQTRTASQSQTQTPSQSQTQTASQSQTQTASQSQPQTASQSQTGTASGSQTPSPAVSPSPSNTPSNTASVSLTPTNTGTPSGTPTPTETPRPTVTLVAPVAAAAFGAGGSRTAVTGFTEEYGQELFSLTPDGTATILANVAAGAGCSDPADLATLSLGPVYAASNGLLFSAAPVDGGARGLYAVDANGASCPVALSTPVVNPVTIVQTPSGVSFVGTDAGTGVRRAWVIPAAEFASGGICTAAKVLAVAPVAAPGGGAPLVADSGAVACAGFTVLFARAPGAAASSLYHFTAGSGAPSAVLLSALGGAPAPAPNPGAPLHPAPLCVNLARTIAYRTAGSRVSVVPLSAAGGVAPTPMTGDAYTQAGALTPVSNGLCFLGTLPATGARSLLCSRNGIQNYVAEGAGATISRKVVAMTSASSSIYVQCRPPGAAPASAPAICEYSTAARRWAAFTRLPTVYAVLNSVAVEDEFPAAPPT